MPPVKTSEVALWRRLLLGEGDGFAPKTIRYTSLIEEGIASLKLGNLDFESPYQEIEKSAVSDDKARPAVQLAYSLQRHGFPFVSVLDGGFPSLVEQLVFLRGVVEPVVLEHDPVKWTQFLHSSGRLLNNSASQSSGLKDNQAKDKSSIPVYIV